MMAGIKTVEDARVGDTITIEAESRRAESALPGYAEAKPMVCREGGREVGRRCATQSDRAGEWNRLWRFPLIKSGNRHKRQIGWTRVELREFLGPSDFSVIFLGYPGPPYDYILIVCSSMGKIDRSMTGRVFSS